MPAMKKKTKKCLTNASKRILITLGGVVIKIRHNGVEIECDTAVEAMDVIQRISEDREEAAEFQRDLPSLPRGTKRTHIFNLRTFQQFVDTLGDPQKRILELLVSHGSASDEDLRKLVGVTSNQQLAGILSGISKQAAALNIPARSVFTIDNESKGGKIEKTYLVSPDLFWVAASMNWPPE